MNKSPAHPLDVESSEDVAEVKVREFRRLTLLGHKVEEFVPHKLRCSISKRNLSQKSSSLRQNCFPCESTCWIVPKPEATRLLLATRPLPAPFRSLDTGGLGTLTRISVVWLPITTTSPYPSQAAVCPKYKEPWIDPEQMNS